MTQREEFEKWMIKDAKIIIGSNDPYPAGLERDYWKVWQAANAIQSQAVGYNITSKLGSMCSFRSNDVKKGDMVYTVNPDQSARVAELEQRLAERDLRYRSCDAYVQELKATNDKLVEQVRVMREALERRKNGSVIDMENTFQGNFRDYTS